MFYCLAKFQNTFVAYSRTVVLVPAKIQDITIGPEKFFHTQYLSRTVFSSLKSVEDGLLIFPSPD